MRLRLTWKATVAKARRSLEGTELSRELARESSDIFMYVEVLVNDKRVEILYGHSISRHLFYVPDIVLSTDDRKSASTF